MAKIYPITQRYIDLRDGNIVSATKIKVVSTSSDYVVIGTAQDAALLATTRTASDPTFYLTSNSSVLNIDGGTVDTEYIVVARHSRINLIGSE